MARVRKPTKITTGWSYAFNMPYFTISECTSTFYNALIKYTKACNIIFTGSAYPWITLSTATNYNIPPYGTTGWWAVAIIKGKGRGKIILNTSPTIINRWAERYPDKNVALVVLESLWDHELWHLLGYTTSQVYNEARLVKLWGKPTTKDFSYPLTITEATGTWALIRTLWQNPFAKKMIVVDVNEDRTT